MNLSHHLSGAASAVALTSFVNRRTRQHAAEVALVATGTDPWPAAVPAASALLAAPPAANADDRLATRTIDSRTSKGLTRYLLQRLPGALYVERQQSRRTGTQTIQSVRFGDTQGFEAWCDEDPVRFSEPHVLAQVRREGTALLQLDCAS